MRKLLLALTAAVYVLAVPTVQAADSSIYDVTTPKRVSVHDPSIVIGYQKNGKITGEKSDGATKVYYIFGSHRAFARSNDLQNWETFTNNISTNYKTIFATDALWAAKGGPQGNSAYDVTGNLWAPDVIWNPTMQKWCMYMSVNGDNWFSSIVLLTAESLDGDWTRVTCRLFGVCHHRAGQADRLLYRPYLRCDTSLPLCQWRWTLHAERHRPLCLLRQRRQYVDDLWLVVRRSLHPAS